jgi:hypothetical protein
MQAACHVRLRERLKNERGRLPPETLETEPGSVSDRRLFLPILPSINGIAPANQRSRTGSQPKKISLFSTKQRYLSSIYRILPIRFGLPVCYSPNRKATWVTRL